MNLKLYRTLQDLYLSQCEYDLLGWFELHHSVRMVKLKRNTLIMFNKWFGNDMWCFKDTWRNCSSINSDLRLFMILITWYDLETLSFEMSWTYSFVGVRLIEKWNHKVYSRSMNFFSRYEILDYDPFNKRLVFTK